MPIKNNNSVARPLTKKVYINWDEQEVLTVEEYEKHLNETMQEMLEDEYILEEWLCDNYDYRNMGRMLMDGEYRIKVMAEFKDYCRDRIKDDEEGEWEEVEITF